jgi:hypothetical protein
MLRVFCLDEVFLEEKGRSLADAVLVDHLLATVLLLES